MSEEEFDPDLHLSNPDGTPKLTQKGTFAKRRGPRPGFAAAPRKAATSKPKKGATDYSEGIQRYFNFASVGLSLAPATRLDGLAVDHYSPPVTKALNDLAQEDPRLAAVLDRILANGPYAELGIAVAPLALQILLNHGALPSRVGKMIGLTPPDELNEMLRQQGEQMAKAAQEESDVPVAA